MAVVILTGAGISAESGLATFRSSDGLWNNYPVEDVASIEGFQKNPALVFDFYRELEEQMSSVQPNAAHKAIADFQNSMAEVRTAFKDAGELLPDELQDVEFEYRYDIASVFDYFDYINVSKFATRIGINPSLLRQYKSGGTYISERQAGKIESAIHRLGQELLAVSLLPR